MIDLVLTHLNQPWGPPRTLATCLKMTIFMMMQVTKFWQMSCMLVKLVEDFWIGQWIEKHFYIAEQTRRVGFHMHGAICGQVWKTVCFDTTQDVHIYMNEQSSTSFMILFQFPETRPQQSGFLLSLPLLFLLPDLLLHQDTVVSMSPPVCFLAPFVTVASLRKWFYFLISAKSTVWVVCYLPTSCTFVVLQACYVTMAEPADTICLVIDVATICHLVICQLPPLLFRSSSLTPSLNNNPLTLGKSTDQATNKIRI